VQLDSGDIKLDLSVVTWVPGTWVPDPIEISLDLWVITLIIENIYFFQVLKFASQGVARVILHPT
jgi:hypothetical protein